MARDVVVPLEAPPRSRRAATVVIAGTVGALLGAGLLLAAHPPPLVGAPSLARDGVADVVTEVALRLPAEVVAPDEKAESAPETAVKAEEPAAEPPKPAVGWTPSQASHGSMPWSRPGTTSKGIETAPAKPAEAPLEATGAADLGPFDEQAVRAAVGAALSRAAACGDGQTRGRGRIVVTIAPSGRATQALLVDAPNLIGTPVGSCIARAMSSISVPPFDGVPVTVTKSVAIH